MNSELSDLLTAIDAADSPVAMQGLIERIVRQFGFEGYSYHKYNPSDASIDYIGEWPHEWLSRYDEKNYIDIDPVAERLFKSVTPFTWQEAVIDRPVNATERVVMNEARDFGIRNGAEIPIHESGMGMASFSVYSSDAEEFQSAWTQNRHDFHLFCLYFHEKYCNLVSGPAAVPNPELTRRERECLVLTSRGKTAWEIGGILSISERTAKDHLASATRKLGCYSKHHAVVKAILTRLILP